MTETEDLRLERFSAGEQYAVDPDAIERELAAIWRTAGRSTDQGQPVTRACLWNIVVHVEERDGREGSGYTDLLVNMINRTPEHLAARGLVLRTRDGAPSLESWISANCILSGDGGKLVCSEEITLAASGDRDQALPSLVRALLVPAIPTAAVFEGVPADNDVMTTALLHLADRLVVYADASLRANPLERVHALVDTTPLSAMDIGWLADRQLRQEIASLFDAPRDQRAVDTIDRVVVVAPSLRQWSARLLLGWIARALGGASATGSMDDGWTVRARNRDVRLVLELSDAERDGCTVQIRVPSEGRTLEVCARQAGTLSVTDHDNVMQKAAIPDRATLLSRALISRASDQAFERALGIARQLV